MNTKKGQTQAVVGVIALVIFVVILTALGPTIVDQTDTSAASDLENASSTGLAIATV